MSRGTREQLFLAVRMSRIQEIKPPLPLILDDSIVNFDSAHRRQAATIISELANTHQIFVLTCHPEIIEHISNEIQDVQYWQLDDGHFKLSDKNGITEFLENSISKNSAKNQI